MNLTGKKGIFFTSIAFLITMVLILTFGTPRTVTMNDQLVPTEARADAVNRQAEDLTQNYLPRSLYVSAYSAFYALSEYMRLNKVQNSKDYFSGTEASFNFNYTLKEIMINGTMCCSLSSSSKICNSDDKADVEKPEKHVSVKECLGIDIMKGKNLTVRLSDMENASRNQLRIITNFSKNYDPMQIDFFQDNRTGPWQVGVNWTLNYSLTAGDVRLATNETITVIFDITGIPDPLYSVESLNSVADGNIPYSNYFNATNLTKWNVSNWNLSTFYHEIEWRLYTYDANGTSFLSRFMGKNDPSPCCGVESLINPNVLTSINGGVPRSYVDWCYYIPDGNDRCSLDRVGSLWNITCISKTKIIDPINDPDPKFYNFMLDSYHAFKYNVSNATYIYHETTPPACPVTPFP